MFNPIEKHFCIAPVLLDLKNTKDHARFDELHNSGKVSAVYDQFLLQVNDLVLGRNPSLPENDPAIQKQVNLYTSNADLQMQGLWAYYPWSGRMVHLLNEEDFVEVRTSRNLFKINQEEQKLLATKRIGVVGLSVGQSAALVMALQRSFAELRLADFDDLRLSNLNRIRAGVHQLGVSKLEIACQEIWELDPFLQLTAFPQGVTSANIEAFILEGGKLDLIIDECDSIKMKIELRRAAKKHGIPLIMETSDRGMLDIERFDLTPDLPLFHGMLSEINDIDQSLESNPSEILFKIIDLKNISERGAFSLGQIKKKIRTWPQLAEDVITGGATAAKVARLVLLGYNVPGGRHYFDLNEGISPA